MSSDHNIEGITVIVQVNGRICLAPIKPEAAEVFIGMLSAFQPGDDRIKATTTLIPFPPALADKVREFGRALGEHIQAKEQSHAR